jgi:SAM-dependent methyltransferase
MSFKDNFSAQSELYVRYRPTYPQQLYEYLSSLVNGRDLVWDCGTGNGQAARDLKSYFKKVIATDPSEQQIRNCTALTGVDYRVERSEESSLETGSADLITIATALHWFDFDKFYSEAKRVLKDDGIIAAWGYSWSSINEEIDKVMRHFHNDVVGEFWQHENRLLEKEYTTIPFPFVEIAAPRFKCEKQMNLEEFIGYLKTWSATQRFLNHYEYDPTIKLRNELLELWGDPDHKHTVSWNLTLRVGRKP